jgi:hypothetical protein
MATHFPPLYFSRYIRKKWNRHHNNSTLHHTVRHFTHRNPSTSRYLIDLTQQIPGDLTVIKRKYAVYHRNFLESTRPNLQTSQIRTVVLMDVIGTVQALYRNPHREIRGALNNDNYQLSPSHRQSCCARFCVIKAEYIF